LQSAEARAGVSCQHVDANNELLSDDDFIVQRRILQALQPPAMQIISKDQIVCLDRDRDYLLKRTGDATYQEPQTTSDIRQPVSGGLTTISSISR
jgi:hypothetical protein